MMIAKATMPATVRTRTRHGRRRRLIGRALDAVVELADHGRGARRVIVVQQAVRVVVDVAVFALGFEVGERPQQELSFVLVGARGRPSPVVLVFLTRPPHDGFVVGSRGQPGRAAPAPQGEHDERASEHDNQDRYSPHDDAQARVRRG
jgi:hypothetical protein